MNITVSSHQVYKPNLFYLVYKRLRPAFGLPFGFILMYGAYTSSLTALLLLVGLGFVFIHLFGDCYNDYRDYGEDLRNKRWDKLTVCRNLSIEDMRSLSFLLLIIGLMVLASIDILLLALGLYYAVLLWAYSQPSIRLKNYNVFGYGVVASTFLFLPPALAFFFHTFPLGGVIISSILFFSQYTYILCQKDSTDLRDTGRNLFLDRGWGRSSLITSIFAILSSLSLFCMCVGNFGLLLIWAINAYLKILNVTKIWGKEISRGLRSKLILVEFLTPCLYVGVMIL